MTDTLYDKLGVAPDASPEEIKRAGRKAQKTHHPDKGGDPEAFRDVTKALKVLLDPARREQYDRTGEAPEGNPEDLEAAEALSLLAQIIAQATATADPRYLDLPKEIRRTVESVNRGLLDKQAHAEYESQARIVKLEAFMKRMKKRKGDDMVRTVMEGEIGRLRRDSATRKAHHDRAMRISGRIWEMLDGYE